MSDGGLVDMGGYALYVWGAYGLTALAMGGELVLLRKRWRGRRDASRSTEAEAR